MTQIATKRTFAEMQSDIQAQKNNSDLSNLASAVEYIKANRSELKRVYEKALEELAELETKIFETASAIETGDVKTVDDVRSLYDKAHRGLNLKQIAVSL